jgi:hypothetical protein
MATRTFMLWLLVLLHGSLASDVNSPEASSGDVEEGEAAQLPGAPSGGEEGEEEGESYGSYSYESYGSRPDWAKARASYGDDAFGPIVWHDTYDEDWHDFPVGPPPAPPLPPRSPISAATALPPAACGSKTPERAIREGDLIAFECASTALEPLLLLACLPWCSTVAT